MPERYDVLEAKGNKPMTEKEMMVKFWVDAKRREAEKLKHNVRPTSMKMKNGDVVQVMNYQTTLLLQRKFPLNDLPWLMAWRWEKHKERYTGHRHKNIRQSYHGMQVNTLWAMSPWWEWNKRYAVDHANKQIYGVLHHNRDGKMWELYQKIK